MKIYISTFGTYPQCTSTDLARVKKNAEDTHERREPSDAYEWRPEAGERLIGYRKLKGRWAKIDTTIMTVDLDDNEARAALQQED